MSCDCSSPDSGPLRNALSEYRCWLIIGCLQALNNLMLVRKSCVFKADKVVI
jgi:hypothetical protein